MASHGFNSFYMASCESIFLKTLYVELFCQMIYQNDSNSTDKASYGAQVQKNGSSDEVKPCQNEA